MIAKKEYDEAIITLRNLKKYNGTPPQELLDIIRRYEEQEKQEEQEEQEKQEEQEEQEEEASDTPIYSKLKVEAKYPLTPEKMACIEETVDELLSDAENATDPGLLLGKIQCGKTDTFENIIGLAFDKGIDIAIVLTKGTSALINQTINRMRDDYKFFKESDDLTQRATIHVEDIMENKGGFSRSFIDSGKTVIVAKKESKNLKYLLDIFSEPWMQEKKVLIVDDEADFASRNYRNARLSVKNDKEGKMKVQKGEITMAPISQQIDELRLLPAYCRYLQVTATPYSLFLQPGDKAINVVGGTALPFRPRFTKLVPVHNKYIGGKQYYVDSKDEDSMFSYLYKPVSAKCIDALSHQNRTYLRTGIASGNLMGLTDALVSYLMATAIRRIQRRKGEKSYKSSALIHVDIAKENHQWQERLVKFMLTQLDEYFRHNTADPRLDAIVTEVYNDFKASTEKAIKFGKTNEDGSISVIDVEYPSLDDVKKEVAAIFKEEDICNVNNKAVKIVNSTNNVESLLDRENGQLRLDAAINIFIGGSILDRGITINNMLCFFYGRDPKNFQQDTVLQHARFYGARDLEDMAVTRLYTTDDIYKVLARMHDLDEELRNWIINNPDELQEGLTFVGYDKNIKPCATSKIKPSNTLTISGQKTFAPQGMWTGSERSISKIVKEIDTLIESCPGYAHKDEYGFFDMDAATAKAILKKICETYRYSESKGNMAQKSDMKELMGAFTYCTTKSGNRVRVAHRLNRDMTRIRKDGRWVDMPADGRGDIIPAKEKEAIETPVLILLRENGAEAYRDDDPSHENYGWNNTPFYWPVLITQGNIGTVLFAIDQKGPANVVVSDFSELTKGIDPEEILQLTYKGDLINHFGEEGSEYELEDAPVETRAVRDTTASKFFDKDLEGHLALAPGVEMDENWAGVYSYNHGELPFLLRPYRYMLLRAGRTGNTAAMLLELFPKEGWTIFANQEIGPTGMIVDFIEDKELIGATDTLIGMDMEEKEYIHKYLCQWVIQYPVKKVLKYKERFVSEESDEE